MTLMSWVRHRARARGRNLGLALFLIAGACGDDGGNGQPTADSGADMAQAPVDSAADTAPAPADGGADMAQAPADVGGVDGAGCQPPTLVEYRAPGCGASAQRVCSQPTIDSCAALIPYCGCDGKTITGTCNGSAGEPFLHMGACRDGGTSDAM